MQHGSELVCPACGSALTPGLAQCSRCGHALSHATGGALPSAGLNLGASRLALLGAVRARRRSERAKLLVALIAGPLAIVLLAGLAWKLLVTSDGAKAAASGLVSSRPVATASAPSQLSELARLDQAALLSRARMRAQSWHKEALLVMLEAAPVSAGKVEIQSGGQLSYEFAKPAGERLGPGARVSSERLLVSVGEHGFDVSERAAGAARAVADPDCPLEEAFRRALAGGLSSSAPLRMRYAMSDTYDRAVWTVSETEEPKRTRYLDGSNCVILVR